MSPFENEGAATAAEQTPETAASETGAEAPQTGEPLGASEGVPSNVEPTAPEEGGSDAEQPAATTEEPAGETVVTEATVSDEPQKVAAEAEPPINVPVRTFAAGTKLLFGSSTVTLTEDATFTYDEAENEQHFAATCQITGNYDVNARLLEKQYDLNGRVIEG